MDASAYNFIDHWTIEGDINDAWDVIINGADLSRWWPSTYLSSRLLQKGDTDRLGERIGIHARGWLPYTLRFDYHLTTVEKPSRLIFEANGDFDGRGEWTLRQKEEIVEMTFDWRIEFDKKFVHTLSFLFKPIFESNHHWTMRRGEESMNLELARRRAVASRSDVKIPSPPGPSYTATVAAAAAGAGLLYLGWKRAARDTAEQ